MYICSGNKRFTTMGDLNRERFHHDETPKLNAGSGLGPLAIIAVIVLAILYYLLT